MDTIEKTFLECEELARERTEYIAHISDTIKRANLLIKDLHVEGLEANYSSDTMSIRLSISENGKIYVNAFDGSTDTNINRPLDETKVYYRVYIYESCLKELKGE